MTAQIQAEITRLLYIVRYSKKPESDVAASQICKLKKKLLEEGK